MCDIETAVDARIDAFRPDTVPPFERLVARRRARRAKTWTGGAALVVAAAVGVTEFGVVDVLHRGRDSSNQVADSGPINGGDAGLGPDDLSPPELRPLPATALLQTTFTGGHAIGAQPSVPEIALRLHDDGILLSATGRTVAGRWQQSHLTSNELIRVRRLVDDAGLATGGRDYGTPTNAGFTGSGIVYQVNARAGVATSAIAYGGTVNGVASSDAGLTQAQRDARERIAELTAILGRVAARATTTYTPTRWSRYAAPSPTAAAIDVAAFPAWAGGTALDSGQQRSDGLRCVPVGDPAADAGRAHFDGSYRAGGTAWVVRYDPVLPDEDACTAASSTRR